MKKTLWILVAVAALGAGWFALPEDTEAICCIRCILGGTTPPAWGMGANCTQAVNDAIAHASALIPGSCEVCEEIPVEVTPCAICGTHPDDPPDCIAAGQFRADYSIRYKCVEDFSL